MKYYLFSLVLWDEILFHSRFKPTGHTPEGVSSRNSNAPEATNRGLAKKLRWCVDFYKPILFFICDLPLQLILIVCGFVLFLIFSSKCCLCLILWCQFGRALGLGATLRASFQTCTKKCKGGVSKELLKSLVLGGIKLKKKLMEVQFATFILNVPPAVARNQISWGHVTRLARLISHQ